MSVLFHKALLKKMLATRLRLMAVCGMLVLGGVSWGARQTGVPRVSPTPPTSRHIRGVIKGGVSRAGSAGISLGGAEPLLRPINLLPRVEDHTFEDVSQKLDGLDCTNCTFKNVTLEYEGGIFNLPNATFSGTTHVVLKGAAANASSLVSMLAAIGSNSRTASPRLNQPVVKSTIAKQPVTLTWKSPYGRVPDNDN